MQEKSFEGTERLYYADSELAEFEATVISCEEASDGCYHVVLDRTAFFPEGGGQFGDIGSLENAGDVINVTDTHEKDGVIIHYTDAPLTCGQQVSGHLNMQVRFDRMQQHSGEHIVSGLALSLYGLNNVGFHLGPDVTTLDFDGPLSQQQIENLERLSNAAIWKNIEVTTLFPTKEEEKTIDYRSKLDIAGQVRLVLFPGYDICACCAPHVKRTGEIGQIKIAAAINYKGGMRLSMLAGSRALGDYIMKDKTVRALSESFSVPASGVAEAVSKAKAESENRRQSVIMWQQRYMEEVKPQIRTSASGKTYILDFRHDLDMNVARNFVNAHVSEADFTAIFVGQDDSFHYIIGSEKNLAREISAAVNQSLSGRGGGKPEMTQGSVSAEADSIKNFIHTL